MWNCTHFRHATDEQLGQLDIFFSNYYNLQSVYFELGSCTKMEQQVITRSNDRMFHLTELTFSFMKNNKQLFKTMERCINFS